MQGNTLRFRITQYAKSPEHHFLQHWTGKPLHKSSVSCRNIKRARLIATNYTVRSQPCALQREGEAMYPGEVFTGCDWQYDGQLHLTIECFSMKR